MNTCSAVVAATGKPCTLKARAGTSFCGRHRHFILCPICLQSVQKSESLALHCKHSFCVSCYNTWKSRNHTCPCCRVPMIMESASECDIICTLSSLFNKLHRFQLTVEKRVCLIDDVCYVLNSPGGSELLRKYDQFRNTVLIRLAELQSDFVQLDVPFSNNFKLIIHAWLK